MAFTPSAAISDHLRPQFAVGWTFSHEEGEEKNNERGKDCERKEAQALRIPPRILLVYLWSLSCLTVMLVPLLQSCHDGEELFLMIVKTVWMNDESTERREGPSFWYFVDCLFTKYYS